MGLNLKMFDTLGTMTVVTPPSMMNPGKLSFTIINLKEKEKNHFAKQLNKLFPNDNITVYIYDNPGYQAWLEEAVTKSTYVIMDENKAPIWIKEMAPEKKTYYVSEERTIEQTFEVINKKESKV
jgi:hypothetical protein|tara:strand:- start:1067 stop:1438 length:372 start_codon:yes stop_codon:yes gene_type:complete